MVNVKHRIPCFDSEILVNEIGGDTYELTIQADTNPLGFGNRLASFGSQDRAMEAAELFCRLYQAAREKGYHLKEGAFVKADKASIQVADCLHGRLSIEKLQEQMQ